MKKIVVVFIILILLVALFLKFRGASVDKTQYVAQVNGEGITRTDYQKNLEQTKNFFLSQKQDPATLSSLENDVLNTMIDESLVLSYAKHEHITVTDSEVNARYASVVAGYNRNNKVTKGGDDAFLSRIKEMYGTDKNTYLAQVKMDILKEKVQEKVKMPLVQWLTEQKKSATINRF